MGIKLSPPPADLTSDAVQNKLDATLFKRIHDGKANTAMGAWSYALSDDEIWDVLAYVRTLGWQ
jgi:mono/diheme cytochrome c family protein